MRALRGDLARDARRLRRVLLLLARVAGQIAPRPIGVEARREDAVGGRQALLLERVRHAAVGHHHFRGHAVSELQIMVVGHRKRIFADVHMQVDHAGHDELACRVDDPVTGRPGARTATAERHRVERDHLRDPVALDHDVVGTGRRSAMPRNHHRIEDDEAAIGTRRQIAMILRRRDRRRRNDRRTHGKRGARCEHRHARRHAHRLLHHPAHAILPRHSVVIVRKPGSSGPPVIPDRPPQSARRDRPPDPPHRARRPRAANPRRRPSRPTGSAAGRRRRAPPGRARRRRPGTSR